MVGGLVVLLGMGVFQLALVLYVRNALISDASEGARLGARRAPRSTRERLARATSSPATSTGRMHRASPRRGRRPRRASRSSK